MVRKLHKRTKKPQNLSSEIKRATGYDKKRTIVRAPRREKSAYKSRVLREENRGNAKGEYRDLKPKALPSPKKAWKKVEHNFDRWGRVIP